MEMNNTSWPNLYKSYEDVEQRIEQKDYSTAVQKMRTTLEILVKLFYDKYDAKCPKDLYTQISVLSDVGIISKSSTDNYHTIRIKGNEASHEYREFSQSEVKRIFKLLNSEIKLWDDKYCKEMSAIQASSLKNYLKELEKKQEYEQNRDTNHDYDRRKTIHDYNRSAIHEYNRRYANHEYYRKKKLEELKKESRKKVRVFSLFLLLISFCLWHVISLTSGNLSFLLTVGNFLFCIAAIHGIITGELSLFEVIFRI